MESIVLRNISFSYEAEKILDRFSCEIPVGRATCIMGASGCGKTTLIHIISGLLNQSEGEIIGLENKKIALVFQDNRLCEDFSVISNIHFVTGSRISEEKVFGVLRELGLSDSANKKAKDLSGGMKKRLAIARAILFEPDVLILDEAFEALDEQRKISVMKFVSERMKGKTIISVTHDESEAELMGAEILKM